MISDVFDNANHNTYTVNGHRTIYVVEGVQCLMSSTAVQTSSRRNRTIIYKTWTMTSTQVMNGWKKKYLRKSNIKGKTFRDNKKIRRHVKNQSHPSMLRLCGSARVVIIFNYHLFKIRL